MKGTFARLCNAIKEVLTATYLSLQSLMPAINSHPRYFEETHLKQIISNWIVFRLSLFSILCLASVPFLYCS